MMGSGTMIYIPSFVKNDSGIQKLTLGGGGDSKKHMQDVNILNPTLIFQNKESRLKTIFLLKNLKRYFLTCSHILFGVHVKQLQLTI
jgi:hypothetical protein